MGNVGIVTISFLEGAIRGMGGGEGWLGGCGVDEDLGGNGWIGRFTRYLDGVEFSVLGPLILCSEEDIGVARVGVVLAGDSAAAKPALVASTVIEVGGFT